VVKEHSQPEKKTIKTDKRDRQQSESFCDYLQTEELGKGHCIEISGEGKRVVFSLEEKKLHDV